MEARVPGMGNVAGAVDATSTVPVHTQVQFWNMLEQRAPPIELAALPILSGVGLRSEGSLDNCAEQYARHSLRPGILK